MIFDIVMKEDSDQNNLLSEVSALPGISEAVIIAAKTDVDY